MLDITRIRYSARSQFAKNSAAGIGNRATQGGCQHLLCLAVRTRARERAIVLIPRDIRPRGDRRVVAYRTRQWVLPELATAEHNREGPVGHIHGLGN